MPAGGPEITVVIPVRDGARTLPTLLDSLARQSLARERFEVVVVDNGSRDATRAIAERAGARVLSEAVPNISAARNRGAAAARAPRLAFTDADCVPSPGWLQAFLDEHPTAPLVAGDVLVTTGEPPSALERFERLWRFGQESWVAQGWAATANLSVTREAFEATGGFDPFWSHGGEDVDFCFRAADAGFRLAYCASALVTHAADDDLRTFLRRSFRHGYWSTRAYYRLRLGHRPWRHPLPVLSGRRALAFHGQTCAGASRAEYHRMALLARLHYGARVAGSVTAELRHRAR